VVIVVAALDAWHDRDENPAAAQPALHRHAVPPVRASAGTSRPAWADDMKGGVIGRG
jgi:hypothetical protein